jgi:hypothetical protein
VAHLVRRRGSAIVPDQSVETGSLSDCIRGHRLPTQLRDSENTEIPFTTVFHVLGEHPKQ